MSDKQGVTTELDSIKTIVEALKSLDEHAQRRVLKYAVDVLSIDLQETLGLQNTNSVVVPSVVMGPQTVLRPANGFVAQKDIKSLKEEKQPSSANEMAALVAYYLADFAPAEDRRSEISTEDISQYFKQAGFPLPGKIEKTLANALGSGYLTKGSPGKYKLSPVGYNLVAHSLPRGSGSKKSLTKKAGKK